MAIYHEDIVDIELSTGTLYRSFCNRSIGSADNMANRFGVRVFRDKQPVNLAGVAVQGYFRDPQGNNIAITSGNIVSGNVAEVVLPQACYNYEGQFCLAIKLIGGGVTGTMRIIDGVVDNTNTDSAVAPTSTVPTYQEILAQYEEMVEATDEANEAINRLDISSMDEYINGGQYINIADVLITVERNEFHDGTAYKKDGTTATGPDYSYAKYTGISSAYYYLVSGGSWGANWPFICFYDSNDDLIETFGIFGNKIYLGAVVNPPAATSYMIVNGAYDQKPVVHSIGTTNASTIQGGTVRAFTTLINADFISNNDAYDHMRNWPSNTVYNISANAYSSIADKPETFTSFGNLIKVNGYGYSLEGTEKGGYSQYILSAPGRLWIGIDNGDGIIWSNYDRNPLTKRYLFIGDSYCEGYSHDGNNDGWGTYLAEYMSLDNSRYTRKYTGGYGFANGGFLSLLNASQGTGQYTDIVVMGGFNERNSSFSEINDAIQTFCARARALYPQARILIGCVGWIKAGTDPSSAYDNWEQIRAKISDEILPAYQRAPKYGASYMNLVEYSLNDSLLTDKDGYHPGENGNRQIAVNAANAIMTGTAILRYNPLLRIED